VSEADIQVVRDQFDATNAREFERAMDFYADDVVLVVHPSFGLETGTFEGKQEVGEWFGQWFGIWEKGYRLDIDEARQIGELVFLHANHSGAGRSSGVEVHAETSYLYTVRDGKVVRAELFGIREEALGAAGSPE
jgi:ketosteroid isomerase-like protein